MTSALIGKAKGKDVGAKILVRGDALLMLEVAAWVSGIAGPRALFVAADDGALEALVAALPVLLTQHRILPLPAWDSLPYDRARPSRSTTGRRVASLAWLDEEHDQPALVVTTPEALLQRALST